MKNSLSWLVMRLIEYILNKLVIIWASALEYCGLKMIMKKKSSIPLIQVQMNSIVKSLSEKRMNFRITHSYSKLNRKKNLQNTLSCYHINESHRCNLKKVIVTKKLLSIIAKSTFYWKPRHGRQRKRERI